MTKTTAQNGSCLVKTNSHGPNGPFWSCVYVNHGETITSIRATHSTMKGAERWARKQVANW